MSARPKWMPSSEDVVEAHPIPEALYGADVSTYCNCGDCLHYQTGLRAQIAVLEEVVQFFNPDGLALNEEDWLLHKLAALRKELSND